MEKIYLLQVLETYFEVSAENITELKNKGAILRDQRGSGKS